MAVQLSEAVRNARLNAIETTMGTAAVFKVRTGAAPSTAGAADSGTVLVSFSCPSDYFNAASGGAMTKLGVWQDTSADTAGVAAHFRVYANDGTTCHIQGTVGQGSGDLSLDNTNIAAGQQVTVNTFTLTDGNA